LDDFLNTINSIKLKLSSSENSSDFNTKNNTIHMISELYNSHSVFRKEYDSLKISLSVDLGHSLENKQAEEKVIYNRLEYDRSKEEKIKAGDEIMEDLRGKAKVIKNGAVMISDELKLQDPLLDNLERNVNIF
jgi:hypothetical protein